MSALFDKTQYFTNCFTIHSKDMDFSFTVCQNSAFRSFFGIRNNKFTDRTRAIRTFRVKKNIKERVVRGEKNISQRTQVRRWIEQAAQVIAGRHKWKMARRSWQCTFSKCSSPTLTYRNSHFLAPTLCQDFILSIEEAGSKCKTRSFGTNLHSVENSYTVCCGWIWG